MDEIDKNIELGIIQGKSIKWAEPHEYILGASVITEVPLNKYIKWFKQQRRLRKDNKHFQKRTIDFIDDNYIVNWAWIE